MPDVAILLIGRHSDTFRDGLVESHRGLAARVHATGELGAAEIVAHLRACDLLVQPYPDGISTRRTTAMAALANGVSVVTNLGSLSETLWPGNAVAATSSPDPRRWHALRPVFCRIPNRVLTSPAEGPSCMHDRSQSRRLFRVYGTARDPTTTIAHDRAFLRGRADRRLAHELSARVGIDGK